MQDPKFTLDDLTNRHDERHSHSICSAPSPIIVGLLAFLSLRNLI